jgi:hypothetical protein
MKIRIILFICIIYASKPINAQKNAFTFGVKLGGNIGAPIPFGHIPNGATGAPVVGLNLGSWAAYYFSPKLSLNLEFNYSVKGASFKTPLVNQYYEDVQHLPKPDGTFEDVTIITFFNGKAEGKFDNQYLEWPIILSYKPFKKVCLIGGIYFAYMFSSSTYATGEGTVGYSPTVVTRSLPFDEELTKFDYGPILGAKYENGGRFSFDGRMAYGVPSVFKKSYKTINYSINNSYFQFTVYYRLGRDIGFEKS